MLTDAQRDIIKATVPLLETGGEALTTHFYKLMLSEYPQVRPLFNQAHQASGAQQRALANGVLMYARNIDRLEALGPLAAQIVNKHVALQIQPEHYPIVGACLLRAIREVLGEEIATDAVIAAWGAAYQQLADILIGAEREVYNTLAAAPGGWRGARAFRVVRKVPESAEITSFYLEPVDGGQVLDFKPGQYIGLRLVVDGEEIRRNYSLSAAPNGRCYRISVKREQGGVASNFLHDRVAEGSTLELFPPAGQFTLVDSDRPLVFISGGVGITPTLAMAEAALHAERPITFIHYAKRGEQAYVVPVGGSNALGSLGYVDCAYEMASQYADSGLNAPDYVVVVTGSVGTYAGLVAGCTDAWPHTKVLGIVVNQYQFSRRENVAQMTNEVAQLAGIRRQWAAEELHLDYDYIGAGYGIRSEAGDSAIELVAQTEGILLDPTYTGKAFAGLLGSVRSGAIPPGSRVLFVHSGGAIANLVG